MPRKEYYEKWKKEGKCPSCSKKKIKGKSLCKKCLKAQLKATLKYEKKLHLKALQKISKEEIPYCINCGCKDLRVLEINHINLNGTQERNKLGSSKKFYRNIISGRRPIKDLNVLCKVCNAIHYCEKKFGLKWEIKSRA